MYLHAAWLTARASALREYNIARIFEAQGDWKQAEQNFWWARQNQPMKVYDDAILRMQRKQAGAK